MKKIIIALYFLLFSLSSIAQDCKTFYYFFENSEIEMTNYDKKGRISGKNNYKITEVKNDQGNFSSIVNYNSVDDKGKTLSTGMGIFNCNGKTMDIDMKMVLPQEQMHAYKDMEVKAQNAFLVYPTTLETGNSLEDGNLNMEIVNNGATFSTIEFTIKNRSVGEKESITTPAGTRDCYKISYDILMNMTAMGMKVPVNLKALEWYAPAFGVIKTETYSKNNKLMGSTVLTNLKK